MDGFPLFDFDNAISLVRSAWIHDAVVGVRLQVRTMGVAEEDHVGAFSKGGFGDAAKPGFHSIAMAVGHEDFDVSQVETAGFLSARIIVTIAFYAQHGDVVEGSRRVGFMVAKVQNEAGLFFGGDLRHLLFLAMGIGKD